MTINNESGTQRAILDWLKLNKIFCWRNNNTPTYDPKLGVYRKMGSHQMKGVPDILFITPDGRFGAIEVKDKFSINAPSESGYPSLEQIEFLDAVNYRGGVAFVARDLEDVIANFTIDKIQPCLVCLDSKRESKKEVVINYTFLTEFWDFIKDKCFQLEGFHYSEHETVKELFISVMRHNWHEIETAYKLLKSRANKTSAGTSESLLNIYKRFLGLKKTIYKFLEVTYETSKGTRRFKENLKNYVYKV